MVLLPETTRKLKEADHHLGQLNKLHKMNYTNTINPDQQEFRSQLSAFLSAARSVTLVLQKEQKAAYDAVFSIWKKGLSTEELTLLKFFN